MTEKQTAESVTLRLIRIPKAERQHKARRENYEYLLSGLERGPKSAEIYDQIAEVKLRIKKLDEEVDRWNYTSGSGRILHVEIDETFEAWPKFARTLLRKDDDRVKQAKEYGKRLKVKLENAKKMPASPAHDAYVEFLRSELELYGNEKKCEELRMFESVEPKKDKKDDKEGK
jgi:hypothetical protein